MFVKIKFQVTTYAATTMVCGGLSVYLQSIRWLLFYCLPTYLPLHAAAPMGPRSCKNLTAPQNGVLDLSQGVLSGAMAKITCRVGYVLNGTTMRICDLNKDGAWSNTQPTCLRK